jgi:hypothetical protein
LRDVRITEHFELRAGKLLPQRRKHRQGEDEIADCAAADHENFGLGWTQEIEDVTELIPSHFRGSSGAMPDTNDFDPSRLVVYLVNEPVGRMNDFPQTILAKLRNHPAQSWKIFEHTQMPDNLPGHP